MLSYQTKGECLECSSIEEAMSSVNKKLAEYGKIHYNKITKMSSACYDKQKVADLITYKGILNHLLHNSCYYAFDYKEILSKVKTLTI